MGELPCLGDIGMCSPKGYGFSAVMVITRVFKLFLSFLVINRVWFLHSSLDLSTFLRRGHFFFIIEKKMNKSPSQIMFTVIEHWSELGFQIFGQVINGFGISQILVISWIRVLGSRPHTPSQFFWN